MFEMCLGDHPSSDENPPSARFLRSMSSNLSPNESHPNEERSSTFHGNNSMDPTMANDATQLILTRLGISRRKFLFLNHLGNKK